ncbi:AAA family ATPase [Novosphingobium bradum]|uniref:AAA family ATPase n=1 Tax=Novosphingobium bradum TaxID=1737444 RepID=A0ABV7IRX9_9SPHN
MTALPAPAYPITENGALYDQAQADRFFAMLFGHVDWQPGQSASILGIGEKGTPQEGKFRERKLIAPAFMGGAHAHLKRWAQWHVAGFVVPAVLHASAADKGEAKLEDVAALTAIVLDIDSGDVNAKAKYVIERLGKPTMMVASGGVTEAGTPKGHLYWLLTEPSEEVERVAALRKTLAMKVGGDQSFGRATQVIRVPGSVHAKNGKARKCSIIQSNDVEYDLDELADIIEGMEPMPGIELVAPAPALSLVGGMDFTPKFDTAINALHRDIHEGGDELNRWGEFSKVAGFQIAEARSGRVTLEAAYHNTLGWMLTHMVPPWPQARFEQEFKALYERDLAARGPMPPVLASALPAELPFEYFCDITPSLTNMWRVQNTWPLTGLGLVYGSPGSGKSFYMLDLAARVAAGMDIDGRSVRPCPVVYVVAEGQTGFRHRVFAWRQRHGIDGDVPFVTVPCAVNLLDPRADLARLIDGIRMQAERLGGAPGFIVVDTLAATFGGGDENTSDMLAYVNNLARLRDEFGAMIVAVHHRPKDQLNDTPRGHGSLMGAVDTIIRLDGDPTGGVDHVRTATVTKQKDGEAGQCFGFTIESITLGEDEKGNPVAAGVAIPAVVRAKKKKLGEAARNALDVLGAAISEAGGASVTEKAWREKWEATLPEDTKGETRRKAWVRCRKALLDAEQVEMEHGLWSIIEAGSSDETMDFSSAAGRGG